MTPLYLYSVRKSRGRAEQIGQDSQTSPLWLWSRSSSLTFPEALSAMTQGFHYQHNQKPSLHQPATQKILLAGRRGLCHDLVRHTLQQRGKWDCNKIKNKKRTKHKRETDGLYVMTNHVIMAAPNKKGEWLDTSKLQIVASPPHPPLFKLMRMRQPRLCTHTVWQGKDFKL